MPEFRQDRLYSMLLNTGLQIKDNSLYQVIYQLIGAINNLAVGVGGFSGGGGGSTVINNTINNIQLSLESGSGDGGDSISIPGPPGPAGASGANGMVPYFIATGETFTVPVFKQALFSMNIDNEGTLAIDGFLIEVD